MCAKFKDYPSPLDWALIMLAEFQVKKYLTFTMMSNNSNNFSSLLVLSWNCNGLTHKIHELRSFVVSNPQFDIILLQELRLFNHNYNIPGFTLHYTPFCKEFLYFFSYRKWSLVSGILTTLMRSLQDFCK